MLLKDIYRKVPYGYSIILQNGYHKILWIYLKFFNLIKYKNIDMFNDINIETTTFCNRRCEYCPNSKFDRSLKQNEKLMTQDTFKKVIKDLKAIRYSGRISPHFYGEPLTDKRLVELLKYAHENIPKAKLEIYTNGDLLSIDMLESFYAIGVNNFVVTLHGNDEERKHNKERIYGLKKYIKENKKAIKMDIIDISSNYYLSNRAGLVNVKNKSKAIACQYATSPLVMNYNGDVLLCCNDYLGQVIFGNVRKKSLLDIWNDIRFKNIRNEIRKNKFRLNICKKCIS